MITVQEIVRRVRTTINDTREEYRNSNEEVFDWITDCINTILNRAPAYFSRSGSLPLVAGVEQSVSGLTRAIAFVAVEGFPQADLSTLDSFRPGWRNGTAGALQNWAPGNTGPASFVIYPPAAGGESLPVVYIEEPVPVTSLTQEINLPDWLMAPIVQFCVGMVEAKDDEHVNSNRAAQAKAEFLALINGAA